MLHRNVLKISVVLVMVIIAGSNCFWLTDSPNNLNETTAVTAINGEFVGEARKKKKKGNLFRALLIGAVLVKMIMFPLVVKAMAIMSSISVLLSTMSLIISSIVGYAKIAFRKPPENIVKVIHVNDVWAKGDEAPLITDGIDYSSNVPLEQVHYNIKR